MLNASKVKYTSTKKADPLEVGNYPARIVQVLDMGVHYPTKQVGKDYVPDTDKAPCTYLMITYELVSEFMKNEDGSDNEEKPRWISERFPLRQLSSENATSTARYKAIDRTMKYNGDWAALLGAPCTVTIGTTSGGNPKVGSVTPPMKGMKIADLVNPPKIFNTEEPDLEIFKSLPEWVQGIMREAIDFEGSALKLALEGKPTTPKAATPPPLPEEPELAEDDGEDLPW